jgi:hypothetical protein
MIDAAVLSGPGYEPRARVDMDQKLAKEMREYKPGSIIKLIIIGSVEELCFEKPEDPSVKGYEGDMRLKIQKTEVMESAKNQMAELMDDDE